MKLLLVFLFSIFIVYSVKAQSLRSMEDEISLTVRTSIKAKDDAEKLLSNAKLLSQVENLLKDKGSFHFTFDSLLKFKMLLESSDGEVRIYNWAIQMDDKTFRYFGFIQHQSKKNKREADVFPLSDKSDEIKNPELAQLSDKKWFGAFYNTIILTKVRKKKIYTLLGWDGNDRITQKKLIETLSFNSSGGIVFGEPVIEIEKEISAYKKVKVNNRRLIFEYKQGIFMTLKWHEKDGLIVYDVLGPTDSSKKGQFSDYGPTLALDAFKWKKGKWILQRDPDARNEKTEKDKEHKTPVPIPDPPK